MSKNERADILLHRLGLCSSRAAAAKLIMAGKVRIGADHIVRKPAEKFCDDTVFLIEAPCPFVSRGAYKLKDALTKYLPSLSGMVALDVGASTGGFTDLMLQCGAERIYAVDVGRGQLAGKLREDSRVVCHEKVNARYIEADFLPERVDVITMDLSFISVKKVLPAAARFLKPSGWAFILVKPQFEAGRGEIGKGGVVRDDAVRQRCAAEVAEFAEFELDWRKIEIAECPIAGPKGNREFMAVFRAGTESGL